MRGIISQDAKEGEEGGDSEGEEGSENEEREEREEGDEREAGEEGVRLSRGGHGLTKNMLPLANLTGSESMLQLCVVSCSRRILRSILRHAFPFIRRVADSPGRYFTGSLRRTSCTNFEGSNFKVPFMSKFPLLCLLCLLSLLCQNSLYDWSPTCSNGQDVHTSTTIE